MKLILQEGEKLMVRKVDELKIGMKIVYARQKKFQGLNYKNHSSVLSTKQLLQLFMVSSFQWFQQLFLKRRQNRCVFNVNQTLL